MNSLFRSEAIKSRTVCLDGEIILARPFSSWLLVAGAIGFSVTILLYLMFGQYTKRATVSGMLQPAQGAIRILPPSAGTIVERRVTEGQFVRRGQVIFVLSDERRSIGGHDSVRLSDQRAESLNQKRVKLRQMIQSEYAVQKQTISEARSRLENLKNEFDRNKQGIALQHQRIDSAERIFERHKTLASEGFISELALEEKRDQVSVQRAQLLSLQQQQSELSRNINTAQSDLAMAPEHSKSRIADIERELAALNQETAETESRDRFAISAPADGLITAITGQVGQVVSNQAIANLLPKDGEIVAHLFAPSKAIGFVRVGQKVRLRFQAFPYQKYGQYQGTVSEVSRNPIFPNDLPPMVQEAHEGMYRIVVRLDKTAFLIDRKPLQLLPGMIVDADIEQESRRLIEWIIEPIYTLRNRIE
jgi:membrane fusion protein